MNAERSGSHGEPAVLFDVPVTTTAMTALTEGHYPSFTERLRQRLNWLKPPYVTFKRLMNDAYSTRNIRRGGPITRVNVGCGKDVREGWWNIDMVRFPGVQEVRDVTRPWRHRNLQYVYAEHFLEHLSLHQGLAFLQQAGKALQVGGVVRLSTPNLSHAIAMCYQPGPVANLEQRLNDTVLMNACFHGYGHQFLYSEEFLAFLLRELGFEEVKTYDFGESDIADLRNMERHGTLQIDHGLRAVVTVEGRKGERSIAPSPELKALLHQHFDGDLYR